MSHGFLRHSKNKRARWKKVDKKEAAFQQHEDTIIGQITLIEKRKFAVLGLVSVGFSVFFYAVIDAVLFGVVIPESEAPLYWIPVSVIMFVLTFIVTLLPVFMGKNISQTLREEYAGIALLLMTPVVILSSGFLDLISASVIELIRGNPPLNWLNYPNWWWMDPYPLGGWGFPWSLAWLISLISWHEHTMTSDMLMGTILGWTLLLLMWIWYMLDSQKGERSKPSEERSS